MSEDASKALLSAGVIGRIGIVTPSSTPHGPEADRKNKGFAPLLEAELNQGMPKGPNVDRTSDLTSSLPVDSWITLAKANDSNDSVAANAVAALYRFTEQVEAAMPQPEQAANENNPKLSVQT